MSEEATTQMTASGCNVWYKSQSTDQLTSRVRRVPTQREAARRIEVSLSYMLQNIDKPLRVSTLSALTGVSPSYFFSLFKCATGYSPNDYFIRLRVRRACELLQGTHLSVKEVAALLGYNDQYYFSRVFKSVSGVAPSYYRSKNAEFLQEEGNVIPLYSKKEALQAFSTPLFPAPKQFKNSNQNERNLYEQSGNSIPCLNAF